MKHLRKCVGLVLALAVVLSMAVTAFAAETNGSITITGAVAEKHYEIYKVFDLTKSDTAAVAYTIDSDWEDFFTGEGAGYIVEENTGGLNPITVNGQDKFISITDDNVAAFSQDALAYAVGLDPDREADAEGESLVFTGLELGYYLIYPQGASQVKDSYLCICSLTSTVPDAEVVVKAEYPTIEKQDDTVSADLGKVVTYTITGEVPDTTGFASYEYTIEDTMSDGLDFQKDVSVTFGETVMDVSPDYDSIDNGFVLTFDMTEYTVYVGQQITVTYTAVVNENAVAAGEVETNSATLTYSNDPDDSTITTTTPPDVEEVYSSQIVVDKIDGETSTKLAGAEFVLMNSDGDFYNLTDGVVTWGAEEDATVMTTDADGAASFKGLEDGTYRLKEIKAPDGYNLLTQTQEVTVNGADAGDVSVSMTSTVENKSGTVLPSTGGAGTAMFYTCGGILVLLAAVLLITKKRMGTM